MISVVEASTVPHPPEPLWEFFVSDVEQAYEDWHREHLRWRWLSAAVPLGDVRRHMREEQENLPNVVAGAIEPTAGA
jgi:hypothetical protein